MGEVDKELAAFETVAEVLIDFIFDTISEIGGAPVSFAKLKTLLENEPTAQALRRFMLS